MLRISRLKKHAEWAAVDPTTVDGIQILTDAMAFGSDIQLNYKGSGWRDVMPYGWNSSKDGNILLMCYKDTGEIRSYRLDRVNELWVHDSIINPEESSDFDDFEIPELPDMDEIIKATEEEEGLEKPFDEALDTLNSDNNAFMNMYNDFEINPNDIEEGLEDLTEEDFTNVTTDDSIIDENITNDFTLDDTMEDQNEFDMNEFDVPEENQVDILNNNFDINNQEENFNNEDNLEEDNDEENKEL